MRTHCSSVHEVTGYTCGCDGTYGANSCALISQTGTDQIPFGGCNIPDLGDAVACGPSVCLGNEFFCQIDLDDPSMPVQMNASCQPIPVGCIRVIVRVLWKNYPPMRASMVGSLW